MNTKEQLQKALETIYEQEKEIEELRKTCEDLEKRLRAYENPHTPPSRRIRRKLKIIKKPKKRGAPEGHRGATRETPTPDKIEELEPNACPRCKGNHIKIVKSHRKTSEDIQIVKVVTEHDYYDCHCEDCDTDFVTSAEDLPKDGNFGPNILSLWAMLHYFGTMPFDRLSTISGKCFGIGISPAGIHNAIYRTAGIFEPYFRRVKNRVAKSNYVRSDETSYSFNGHKHWLWNISTAKDSLVLIRESRGAIVLKEVFGDFLDGILNSDCFGAYERFKAREYQKCWAHVLRDAKDLAKHNDEGAELYRLLSHMHDYIKRVKSNGEENTPKVRQWVRRSKKNIDSWVDKNYESKAVLNLVLRMSKYTGHWFTCLRYPFVESTNNDSERDIRKGVIARKVSGLHRSELGLRSREIMMSTILSLQRRGRDPFAFVLDGIKKYNLSFNLG